MPPRGQLTRSWSTLVWMVLWSVVLLTARFTLEHLQLDVGEPY